jgi:hypothetical protein
MAVEQTLKNASLEKMLATNYRSEDRVDAKRKLREYKEKQAEEIKLKQAEEV